MIAVVLAGGYAKRIWPLSIDKPKALLPVAGKPVIDYIFQKILKITPPVSKIIVSTNLRFQSQFDEWLEKSGYSSVELVPDNSRSESDKIGAIRALSNVISGEAEDFLVLAGDGLFLDELTGFVHFFEENHAPVVALYTASDIAEAKRGATVSLDGDGRIVNCVEKSENPKTKLIGACIYAFPARICKRLKEYVSLGLPQDQPGKFIEWLCKVEAVYGFMLNGSLLDIGMLESYKEAEKFVGGKH
jgi:glucose-1-phosphate thymidylyltransferase